MKTSQLIRKGLSVNPLLWFKRWWWKYLLETPKGSRKVTSKWKRFWCRAAGHPDGVWWFRFDYGSEPDMKCKCCGDNTD